MRNHRTFLYGFAFELLLLAAAALLGWLVSQPLFAALAWNLWDLIAGMAAAIPPFAFFVWTFTSEIQWAKRLHRILNTDLRAFFRNWSMTEIAIISIVAGIAEEAFFRGVIQLKLANVFGIWTAIILTSVLFGLVHFISTEYALITGVISLYLGFLLWSTGNLLSPIVTHAVYDFAALAYFLRFRPASPAN